MKFELEPDNRGADDEKLLSNLREVSVAAREGLRDERRV